MTLTILGVAGVLVISMATMPGRGALTAGPPAAPTPLAEPTPRRPPGESALHSVVIPGVGSCPDFRPRRGIVPSAELEYYLNSMLDCLMAVNEPGFAQAGFALTRPVVAPESEIGGSGCVSETDQPQTWAGLYCPRGATIYYRTDWSPDDPAEYLDVLVHEFAHHLQHEAGILRQVSTDQATARRQVNGEIQAQELSRRIELQAECLAGTIVGPQGPIPLPPRELAYLVDLRSSVPPEWAGTHGTGRSQKRWFELGVRTVGQDRYATCNTFIAPADTVE